MSGLKIIKASAGSGKTHTLTSEYIELLNRGERAYRHILAVTFTNKATEEMKRRVVETLYKDSLVNPQSGKILTEILHDYSSFAISTIDRFFQQTMRAFAREIGKNSAYSVELDQDMVLSEAIDNMVINLDKEENSDLLEWLTTFGTDAVESGSGWNFKGKLTSLAKEIFKERYKSMRGDSSFDVIDKGSLSVFRDKLIGIKREFENSVLEISKSALLSMERYNLQPEHFKGGARSQMRFFTKVISGEFPDLPKEFPEMAQNAENLVARTTLKRDPALFNSIENCWSDGLSDALEQVCSLYQRERVLYNTAVAVCGNIHTLGVLSDIEKFVKDYTEERNVVLIPETTELLNKIIDGSDAPFIYEKTGTRIDHFMLDEFQDTSVMQWQNFRPLILESVARGNENLIVGDIKQSIYRWRGSDWNLLNRDIYKDIPKESITGIDLRKNWRSAKNIIDFNNTLFPHLACVCKEHLDSPEVDVYSSVEQEISQRKRENEGHVLVKFFENDRDGPGWKELAMKHTASLIDTWSANGYEMRDITLLVRTNDEGQMLVKYLLERGYPVISDEALLVSSSHVVRRVIAVLKYIINPEDSVNNTIATFLGIDMENVISLSHLPLYELCEEAVREMNRVFDESESLFINSFLDLVLDYGKGENADIAAFIKWWEERGSTKSVPAPEGQNALRVMTIHKAKGLGIPVVVLPFFDIPMDYLYYNAPVIWCNSNIEPYNSFPMLPVKYSKGLEDTIFDKEYRDERVRAYIDNMNLAYVALTRAETEMAVLCSIPPKSGESLSVSKILYSMLEPALEENEYHGGCFTKKCKEDRVAVDSLTIPSFKSYNTESRLKLALRGEEYFNERSSRGQGLIMHRIMENIVTEGDLENALDRAMSDGVLSNEMRGEAERKIRIMFDYVRERHWFDGTLKVYRELEILLPGGAVKRPDRVLMGVEAQVIDFKFGKKMEQSHINQVNEYVNLLKEIGIAYVKGFVWYPEENVIIEV
ncbi:MAG: UvrD-helicase domain-containing protein [Bacteroidales bacterium]|nr:UvrD-helicase domain-containing protein [Bacteroidales bacterium]